MTHKYFTQKLIGQDILDLSNVFTDKIRTIQSTLSINFGLPEIVMFIQQRSNDFTTADTFLKELDFAVQSIIDTYYKSIQKPNPFITKKDNEDILQKRQQGAKPRDAVTTTEAGRVVKKGTTEPEPEEPKRGRGRPPKKVEEVVEEPQDFDENEIREAIEALQILADDGDEEAQEAIDALQLLLP